MAFYWIYNTTRHGCRIHAWAANIQQLKITAAATEAKWRRVGVGVLRGSIAQGTGVEPHYTEGTGSM
jgi:hypothetical protein